MCVCVCVCVCVRANDWHFAIYYRFEQGRQKQTIGQVGLYNAEEAEEWSSLQLVET